MKSIHAMIMYALALIGFILLAPYAHAQNLYTYTNGSANGTSWTVMPAGPADLQVVFGVSWPVGQTMLPSPLSASGQWNVTGGRVLSTNHTSVPTAPALWFGQYQNVLAITSDLAGNCVYLDGVPCQYSTDGYSNILLEGTQTSVVVPNNTGFTGDSILYCLQLFNNTEIDYVGCRYDVHFKGQAPAVGEVSLATDVNGNAVSFVKTNTHPDIWQAGTTDPTGNFTPNVALAPGLYVIDTPDITSCSGRACSIPGGSNFNTYWHPTFTAPPSPPPSDD